MSHIVIIGGHGKVALLAARLLVEQGDTVTSVIRDPSQCGDIEALGATPLVLSVEEAGAVELAAALTGADAVVWSAGAAGKGGPARTDAVDRAAALRSFEAAGRAGVRRYVMVSWIGSRDPHGIPESQPFHHYADAKLAADRALIASGLDWTILGPGPLTLDEPSGRIEVGIPTVGRSAAARTSRANVALTIAAVLADASSIGKIIPFRDGGTPIAEAVSAAPADGSLTAPEGAADGR